MHKAAHTSNNKTLRKYNNVKQTKAMITDRRNVTRLQSCPPHFKNVTRPHYLVKSKNAIFNNKLASIHSCQ